MTPVWSPNHTNSISSKFRFFPFFTCSHLFMPRRLPVQKNFMGFHYKRADAGSDLTSTKIFLQIPSYLLKTTFCETIQSPAPTLGRWASSLTRRLWCLESWSLISVKDKKLSWILFHLANVSGLQPDSNTQKYRVKCIQAVEAWSFRSNTR